MGIARRTGIGIVFALAALALLAPAAAPRARADGVGPTIAVGATTLQGGKIRVAIETRGTGFVPYSGFGIHARWNPAIFAVDSADPAGGPFAGDAALCIGPTASAGDADGAGTIVACALKGSNTVSSSGLLTTLVFTPKGSGCSVIHLTTLGAPDGGDTTTGTYTIEPEGTDVAPQVNAYIDGKVDNTGANCGAQAAPTAVPPGIDRSQPTVTPIPASAITPAPGGNQAAQPGVTQQPGRLPVVTPLSTQQAAAASATAARTTPGAGATTATGATPTPSASTGIVSNAHGTPQAQASTTSGGGGNRTGIIIGVIVGVVAVIALGIGGRLWLLRR
ncbi:MAG: hypothetical protein IVW36_12200 [Dehalococcoidia bacterium]|nr:hypothetical protein [Dehalococcoidia bacterium]